VSEHLTDGWEPGLPVADTVLRPLPFDNPGPTHDALGVFSDMSRPGAEALGFLPITRFTLWHRPRPAATS
jgi:hypothetical protein